MGKVLGYVLIIAIFIAAAYYLAVGQRTKKNPKPETATASATLAPQSTKITIYAAGTPANTEYPTMELKIDGNIVQSWKGVKGDAALGKFDEFTYIYPGVLSDQVLQISFPNDLYLASDDDRNLYVDKMVVGEVTFLADSPSTQTTITEKTSKKCTDGNTYSRWLLCNGYFTFLPYSQAFGPQPTQPVRLLTGRPIKIYAAGKSVGGDYPIFDLNIKGKKVASFRVGGDPEVRLFGEYIYMYTDAENVAISDISLTYVNDYYANVTVDRNLYVDRVNLFGVDYPANGYSVYQTGVWRGNICAEGYLRSNLLWCQGATMRFGARPDPTPR